MTQASRELLLTVAERLFAERGVDAVSLRAVMAEAGTNVAAIHYHFGSKEALIQALAPAADHPWPQAVAEKKEGPPAGTGPECGSHPALPAESAQEGPRVAGSSGGSLNPFEQGLARAAAARDQPGRADQRPLPQGDAEARALLTDEELQALLGSEEDQPEKTRQPSRPGE